MNMENYLDKQGHCLMTFNPKKLGIEEKKKRMKNTKFTKRVSIASPSWIIPGILLQAFRGLKHGVNHSIGFKKRKVDCAGKMKRL